ncbi:MAG: type III-B CRISPR module-associated protein Cmr5 [Stellaceae bacterium]
MPKQAASAAPQQAQTDSQETDATSRPLRKDQQRTLCAYGWADTAKQQGKLDDYEIAVQSFAATLLRSGFAAAVSVLERSADHRDGFALLLDNLAFYTLPGIAATMPPSEWPARVRGLADIGQYMQATRELIALLGWLRRACRALGAEKAPQAEPTG